MNQSVVMTVPCFEMLKYGNISVEDLIARIIMTDDRTKRWIAITVSASLAFGSGTSSNCVGTCISCVCLGLWGMFDQKIRGRFINIAIMRPIFIRNITAVT